jgi:hypothetical protein
VGVSCLFLFLEAKIQHFSLALPKRKCESGWNSIGVTHCFSSSFAKEKESLLWSEVADSPFCHFPELKVAITVVTYKEHAAKRITDA